MEATVPALQRGLDVLALLSAEGEASLVWLCRKTGVPRSSLIRILNTLVSWGAVEELPEGNVYRPIVKLVPCIETETYDTQRLRNTLRTLADETGETAEWFVGNEAGMLLLENAHPENQQVRVLSQPGKIFKWYLELEAVTALGYAFFPVPEKEGAGELQVYREDGILETRAISDLRARIELAKKERIDADPYWNDNGIKRLAALVTIRGEPRGVLALAISYKPGKPNHEAECLEILRHQARKLSTT